MPAISSSEMKSNEITAFDTPVLLIIFNRPETTRRVFDTIRQQKPKYFFVAADGPRPDREADIEKCKSAREIIKVDWVCELKTLYLDKNLGCGRGPANAITWFFSQVEEGIILEDDCLPHPDFFMYCSELLDRFRNAEEIFFIGGTNFQKGIMRGAASYYFSAGHHGTWGWATWKKSWNKFNYYLENVSFEQIKPNLKNLFPNRIQRNYWISIYKEVKKNRYNESCWDYQFYFASWLLNGLAILPNVNLVTNCGFGEDATHTNCEANQLLGLKTASILPLKHPTFIYQDKKADFFFHKKFIQSYEYGWPRLRRLPFRINKSIKEFLGVEGSWIK